MIALESIDFGIPNNCDTCLVLVGISSAISTICSSLLAASYYRPNKNFGFYLFSFLVLNMPSKRCEYHRCNNTRKNYPGRFYKYPKEPAQQREWLKRTGNVLLTNIGEDTLANKLICDRHFNNSIFVSEDKQGLIKNALPIPYEIKRTTSSEDEIPSKMYKKDTKTYPVRSRHIPILLC